VTKKVISFFILSKYDLLPATPLNDRKRSLLFLRPKIFYFNIQTSKAVNTDTIPVSPAVIATAKSAREYTNPTTRPITSERSNAIKSTKNIVRLYNCCPIKITVSEGELDRRVGYWSANEAEDRNNRERWNAAVSSGDRIREETMTSSKRSLGCASRSARWNWNS